MQILYKKNFLLYSFVFITTNLTLSVQGRPLLVPLNVREDISIITNRIEWTNRIEICWNIKNCLSNKVKLKLQIFQRIVINPKEKTGTEHVHYERHTYTARHASRPWTTSTLLPVYTSTLSLVAKGLNFTTQQKLKIFTPYHLLNIIDSSVL